MSQFVLAYRVPKTRLQYMVGLWASRIGERSIATKHDAARPTPNTRKERKVADILGSGVAEMSRVKSYTRVVSTDDGESAFEDAELHLNEQQVADGVPAMFVGALGPAPGVAFLRFAAFDSDPHPASEPQWVVMLRGVIEVQVSDGTSRQFGPGDLVLATDTSGRGHITLTVGDPPFEALMIPSVPAG